MSHTKGPWAVHPFNAQIVAFRDGHESVLAKMLWPTKVRTEAETLANAKLMASAPDLLAALRNLLDQHDNPSETGYTDMAIARARLAIARATTEKP